MTIQLSPEQQRWLEDQVAAGHFASIDQAVAVAIADLMLATEEDLDWMKPLIDEAAASLDRGEGISRDEAIARMRAALKR